MEILTSRKKSQDFAVYFSVSGFSLLVTSLIYFKRLESAWNYEQCDYIFEDENDLCADLCFWTVCAGIGIGIGVLNILLFLFLVCFGRSWCWNLDNCAYDFGYKLSFLENENVVNLKPLDNKYFDASRNKTARSKVKTISPINNDFSERISLELQNRIIPSERKWWLELISWIILIVLHLAGTVFVAAALYKSNAYRRTDENLYHPGLSLFLNSILNLVLFCKLFMWGLCRKLYRKCKSSYEKYEYKCYKSPENGHVTSHSQMIQSV